MRQSILSITSKLALLFLALWVGNVDAQTTSIRGGGSANTASVTGGSLHIRCELGCGGGTQYAEDSAHASGDTVTMAGVVQQSADAALSGDGDRSVLQVDANGYLKVNIKAGAGSGGTAMVDDAAFMPATTSGTPAFFMFDDVAPDSVNEGDGGVGRMSANRNQYVTIRDAAGNERGLNIDSSGNLTANIAGTVTVGSHAVTNAGTFATQPTSVVPGTGATNLGKAEDAAHASGDTGTLLLGVRNDSAVTGLSDTNGDYTPIATDSNGRLFVNTLAAISSSMTPGTAAANLGKAEDAAHASGDTGVAVFAKRTDTAASSSTTDGDYSTINTDSTGRLWTRPTGAVTPANSFSIPTDAITVWSINGCYNGTTIDLCQKASAGQGAVDATTQRVTMAQASTACPNYAPISTTADAVLVSGTSSQYVYICSILIVAGAAEIVGIIEGTGSACGTSSAAIIGSTTEANSLSLSANGGFSAISGLPWLRSATTANDVCIRVSGSNRVSGVITYAKGT